MRYFVALAVALLPALPAQAECFGPDNLPIKLVFDPGGAVEVIARTEKDVTYASLMKGRRTVSVSRFGAFNLLSETEGKEFRRVTWTDPLVAPEDLELGQVRLFHAVVTMEGVGEDIPMLTGLFLVGRETVVVQDCSYEVLVLDRKEVVLGPKGPVFDTRIWYAPSLGLILGSQPKTSNRPRQVLVSLE